MKTALTWLVLFALAAFACGNGESDSNSKTDSTDDDGGVGFRDFAAKLHRAAS